MGHIEQAETLEQAWCILASDPGIIPVAGATAVQLDWRKSGWPNGILDLSTLGGDLSGVTRTEDGGIRIGALTTLAALERNPLVRSRYKALAGIVASIGSPSVRTLGTIGGNVCRIGGCAVPVLAALDATALLYGDGGLREQALPDWLASRVAGADRSILAALVLPPPPDRLAAEKIGLRRAFSPSVVGIAAALHLAPNDRIVAAKLCVGAGASPALLPSAGARLAGTTLDAVCWRELRDALIGEIVAEGDDFRSTRYKALAAANALVWAIGGEAAGRSLHAEPTRTFPIPAPRAAEHAQRQVARGVSPSWPPRPDIRAKVAGSLRYLTDHRDDCMLVGRVLRAGIPHAKIIRLDVSRAESLPGVRAVVTARDVQGLNAYGIIIQDQPALCFDRVRFVGDPVAAVAAIDAETAARALALIDVAYEPLPVVEDVLEALSPDATPIHAGGNLHMADTYERGDLAAAWADCAHIVEDTYVTPRQMHVFMETEGGYARPTPEGGLEIFAGGQSNTRDRMQLARILGWPESRIRVVGSPTGGAFGGKDELTVQPLLALLALKASAPVRLHLDREESTVSGWKRTPFTISMRTGCDAEGKLLAQDVDLLCETGGYASWSGAVMEAALAQGCGPYVVPNVRLAGRTIYTNNGIAGAFRGFGVNQMIFAVESQMDRLAARAGLDPVAIRRLNLRKQGNPGVYGHTMAPSERLEDVLDHAAASDLWRKPRGLDPCGRFLIGVGMGLLAQANGLGSLIPDDGGGRLSLNSDGSIEAAFSFDEFGQGVMALIQASVAASLNCARDDVLPVVGDSDAAPDSGATIASRSATIVGLVARAAGPRLAEKLLDQAALMLNRPAFELRIGAGGIYDTADRQVLSFARLAAWIGADRLPSETAMLSFPKNDSTDRNTLFLHSYGAVVARVAVDRVTGMAQVIELDQHTAAGPVVDPPGYLGQFEGGNVQGLGFALLEDTVLKGGEFVTRNLDTYMAPTIQDAPETMRTYAVESLDPDDPYGPRGIGELSIGGVAAAIACAIGDATGVLVTKLPLDPEWMLDALAVADSPP